MPQIDDDDYPIYCKDKWTDKLFNIMEVFTDHDCICQEDYENFNKFMGWKRGLHFIVDIENPTVQETIDRLHGPHIKTLLEVIKARKFHD